MFINNFDPVAIELFSLEIRWYSLSYIFGILFGWYVGKNFFCRNSIKNNFDDYITFLIIGLIVGGRIGYVLFYNLEYYLNNFFEIFKIWQGGMSFHGAVIGIVIASIIFAKKHNNNFFEYLDVVALVSPIGIFFGRISNFINSELYGYQTDLPWAVKFIKIDDLYRHPSQIYEAIFEGLMLFLILLFFSNKQNFKFPGKLSSLFLIFYSGFRFCIEFFRVPDEQLGLLIYNLTMGQLISFIFFTTGLLLYNFLKNAEKKT